MKFLAYCVTTLLIASGLTFGQQYKVLYSFGGYQAGDGSEPQGDLVMDGTGNIYGTTYLGGGSLEPACAAIGCGAVFELSPDNNGGWTEVLLYSFCSDQVGIQCLDGKYPRAGLTFDSFGNLYGTTENGGNQTCQPDLEGCGTVFELSPPSVPGGSWTEQVVYNFCSSPINLQCLDGYHPLGRVIFDTPGNLYSTTLSGGTGRLADVNDGVVFELSPSSSGWTETVLYNFCSLGTGNFCLDGASPEAGVTLDSSGDLYGTTALGGAPKSLGGGTVYRLSQGPTGWQESVLCAFRPPFIGGGGPVAGVTLDRSGDLYSTVEGGGAYGLGGVFRLSSRGRGKSIFSFNGQDGNGPTAGLVLKGDTLFGTTSGDGFNGSVFKIEAPEQESVLYNFCSQPNCTDGSEPLAGLIMDKSGNLYGNTNLGGANNSGVVFEITP
jgi:hypothetical protein